MRRNHSGWRYSLLNSGSSSFYRCTSREIRGSRWILVDTGRYGSPIKGRCIKPRGFGFFTAHPLRKQGDHIPRGFHD